MHPISRIIFIQSYSGRKFSRGYEFISKTLTSKNQAALHEGMEVWLIGNSKIYIFVSSGIA